MEAVGGNSGVATGGGGGGGQGGQSATPDSEKIAKNQEKEGKYQEKGKNRESFFTLPLLADRAGYTTGWKQV